MEIQAHWFRCPELTKPALGALSSFHRTVCSTHTYPRVVPVCVYIYYLHAVATNGSAPWPPFREETEGGKGKKKLISLSPHLSLVVSCV